MPGGEGKQGQTPESVPRESWGWAPEDPQGYP